MKDIYGSIFTVLLLVSTYSTDGFSADCASHAQIESSLRLIQAEIQASDYQGLAREIHAVLKKEITATELNKLQSFNVVLDNLEKTNFEARIANKFFEAVQQLGANVICENSYRSDLRDSKTHIQWTCSAIVNGKPLIVMMDMNDGHGFIRTSVRQKITSTQALPLSCEIVGKQVERYGSIDAIESKTFIERAIFPATKSGGILLGAGKRYDTNDIQLPELRSDLVQQNKICTP